MREIENQMHLKNVKIKTQRQWRNQSEGWENWKKIELRHRARETSKATETKYRTTPHLHIVSFPSFSNINDLH